MMPMCFRSSNSSKKLKGAMGGGERAEGGPSLSSRIEPAESPMPRKKFRALIVGEDGANRRIHKLVLSSLGGESKEAENGKEAVDLCTVAGAAFDLIIMDLEMPIFDGPKATRLLRSMEISTMIVGVSSSLGPEIVEFMNAGIDAFYVKPITRAEFIPILRDVIKYTN